MIWCESATNMEECRIMDNLFSNLPKPNPILVTNRDLKIVGINEEWVDMCGISPFGAFGNSPRILQGELTNMDCASNFASNICQNNSAWVSIINYKNTEDRRVPFVNHLYGWSFGDIIIAETYMIDN